MEEIRSPNTHRTAKFGDSNTVPASLDAHVVAALDARVVAAIVAFLSLVLFDAPANG